MKIKTRDIIFENNTHVEFSKAFTYKLTLAIKKAATASGTEIESIHINRLESIFGIGNCYHHLEMSINGWDYALEMPIHIDEYERYNIRKKWAHSHGRDVQNAIIEILDWNQSIF